MVPQTGGDSSIRLALSRLASDWLMTSVTLDLRLSFRRKFELWDLIT